MKKIKNKVLIKVFATLAMCLILSSYFNIIYAKYFFENEFYIANINIDITKPKIEFLEISNINVENDYDMNKIYEITMKVKFIERNLNKIFLDKEHIKVKNSGKYIDDFDIEFNKIEENEKEKEYEIKLKNLQTDRKFEIEISEGTLVDKGELENNLFKVEVCLDIYNIENEYYDFEEDYEDLIEYTNEYEETYLLEDDEEGLNDIL